MNHLPPPDLRDADLDEIVPSTKTRWHGLAVEVTARLVPRYCWTTASIDVFLGGQCVLKTGGQMAVIGSSTGEFYQENALHLAELTWGAARGLSFPFELTIDGSKVLVADVPVRNKALIVMPGLVLAAPVWVPLLVVKLVELFWST